MKTIRAILLNANVGLVVALSAIFSCVNGQEKTQEKPGLVAHYYDDTMYWGGHWTSVFPSKETPEKWIFTKYRFTRVEPVVSHSFPIRSWFSVRWQGVVVVEGNSPSEKIAFGLRSKHGCRLKINGKMIVSRWEKEGDDESTTWTEISLAPGRHPIVVEAYFGKNKDAEEGLPIALLWKSKSLGIKETVVPKKAFFHKVEDLLPPDHTKR